MMSVGRRGGLYVQNCHFILLLDMGVVIFECGAD